MSRVLITGGGGFVGQWLARAAATRGDTVILAGIGSPGPALLPADAARSDARWIATDIRLQADVEAMIDAAQPDVVFHLAAVSFPPQAERDPSDTYEVNTIGAVRLLTALASRRGAGMLDPTTLIVGSAVQYGFPLPGSAALTEDAQQKPITVYGASKAAQEVVALQAARSSGLRVVCTRSFNHAGPGQSGDYLIPSLVRRALELRDGTDDRARVLALGNDVVRDFLHVADVATAYIALAERGKTGEVYNVASGTGVRVSELAADILRRAGVSADVSSDPSLARATDIPVLVGSPAKLMQDTGWAPTKTHADIIDDLLRFANASTD